LKYSAANLVIGLEIVLRKLMEVGAVTIMAGIARRHTLPTIEVEVLLAAVEAATSHVSDVASQVSSLLWL
jgi:hypothetical protein